MRCGCLVSVCVFGGEKVFGGVFMCICLRLWSLSVICVVCLFFVLCVLYVFVLSVYIFIECVW